MWLVTRNKMTMSLVVIAKKFSVEAVQDSCCIALVDFASSFPGSDG
ncbi:hypothetical protein PC128_g26853 [Phytophthora cactorum]|nr:hypothetical protein PC128_g26853 [Phytophthora cactorum]